MPQRSAANLGTARATSAEASVALGAPSAPPAPRATQSAELDLSDARGGGRDGSSRGTSIIAPTARGYTGNDLRSR
jgi:hypothetical protein